MATKCKAKNPNKCRYHSKDAFKYITNTIIAYERRLETATSFAESEKIQKVVKAYKLRKDANEYGYKELLTNFKKANKANDFEKQAEIANRLSKAAEERKKDGNPDKWDEANGNYSKLGALVVDEATQNPKVRIPLHLTGASNMLAIYGRFLNEGWKVTGLSNASENSLGDYEEPHGSSTTEMLDQHEQLKAQESKIRDGRYSEVYQEVIRPQYRNKDYIQFRALEVEKNGHKSQIYGAWHMDI